MPYIPDDIEGDEEEHFNLEEHFNYLEWLHYMEQDFGIDWLEE